MDMTINIGLPILMPGESFEVRYRLLPAGAWVPVAPNPTNMPFQILGLAPGEYELGYKLVKADATQCDEVIKTFTVGDSIECLEVALTMEQNAEGGWQIKVEYTDPTPACSYVLSYGIVPNLAVLNYPTLPASPFYLPATNGTYTVIIDAYDCEGNYRRCIEETITPEIPACTHAEVVSAEIIESEGQYWVQLTITPSIPATVSYGVMYAQANNVASGIPEPGGLLSFPAQGTNPEVFTFPINPNLNLNYEDSELILKYIGSISDDCGWLSKWEAELVL